MLYRWTVSRLCRLAQLARGVSGVISCWMVALPLAISACQYVLAHQRPPFFSCAREFALCRRRLLDTFFRERPLLARASCSDNRVTVPVWAVPRRARGLSMGSLRRVTVCTLSTLTMSKTTINFAHLAKAEGIKASHGLRVGPNDPFSPHRIVITRGDEAIRSLLTENSELSTFVVSSFLNGASVASIGRAPHS